MSVQEEIPAAAGSNREPGPKPRPAPVAALHKLFESYSLVVVFVGLIAIFSIAKPDTFFTAENARAIGSTQAVVAILALAAMVPLISGQFDLSVGFQMGLAQALCGGLAIKDGVPVAVAAGIAIVACMVIGLINGFLVVKLKMNALIATLGSGTVVFGFTQWYTNGSAIFGNLPDSFLSLGRNELFGIPLPVFYVVIIAAILWCLFEYTAWGRSVVATGGNSRAALLAGVRTDRVTMVCFVISGFICALAGVMQQMILGSANPEIGPNFLLPAIAGAFLGATSIRPGRFNAVGTVLAVYVLAVGITGLQQIGAKFFVESFFNGGALLIAVALSGWAARRRGEA
ncbi:MAG: ribose transport system permease protein [Thermoleophilaceae bacterium]|jgi:ribose transport system permease protein|nr:ribose transport system permease protein [Thermoleophilaceae bacterium]